MSGTHTYAVLDVSQATYDEVRRRLMDVGYDHTIHNSGLGDEVIDMHGIALKAEPQLEQKSGG